MKRSEMKSIILSSYRYFVNCIRKHSVYAQPDSGYCFILNVRQLVLELSCWPVEAFFLVKILIFNYISKKITCLNVLLNLNKIHIFALTFVAKRFEG